MGSGRYRVEKLPPSVAALPVAGVPVPRDELPLLLEAMWEEERRAAEVARAAAAADSVRKGLVRCSVGGFGGW